MLLNEIGVEDKVFFFKFFEFAMAPPTLKLYNFRNGVRKNGVFLKP